MSESSDEHADPEKSIISSSRLLRRAGEALALLTILGVVAQAISYISAGAYYNAFGLTPDQVGITPLNALLRLSTTSLVVAALLTATTLLYSSRRARRTFSGRHRAPDISTLEIARLVRSRTLASILGTVILIAFAFFLLGKFGAEAYIYNQRTYFNPVAGDLAPSPAFMRWTKVEEIPIGIIGDSALNFRYVAYIGTNGGLSYFLDVATNGVLVVPATQVQFVIVTPTFHLSSPGPH